MERKSCEFCHLKFTPSKSHPYQKYCSQKCSKKMEMSKRFPPLERKICPVCGEKFQPRRNTKKYCSIKCQSKFFNHPTPKIENICIHCNAIFMGRKGRKYCDFCRKNSAKIEWGKNKNNPTLKKNHSQSVRLYQKQNPDKVRAQVIAYSNPKAITIHYECPCSHTKKHNHHFDYSRPLDVIRLCPTCHRVEHKRLRAERKQLEATA
jgi:hypothetical protein